MICKKCGKEYNASDKNELCPDCQRASKKTIASILGASLAIAGTVAGAVYIKKNPETLEKIKELFQDIPALFERGTKAVADSAENMISATADIASNVKTNYLTALDQKKLDLARREGILPDYVINNAKYELEHGFRTVDELLATWKGKTISETFPDWHNRVSELTMDQFEEIVKRAAESVSKVKDVKILDHEIMIDVESGSGKSSWPAFINFFTDNGKLSSNCEYSQTYSNANVPSSFIEAVIREMKYFIETQMDT